MLDDCPSINSFRLRPDRKDFIMASIRPEIPYEDNLCKRPLCHTLSKALDISKAIARASNLLSRVRLIRSVNTVKTSAVDLDDRKPY